MTAVDSWLRLRKHWRSLTHASLVIVTHSAFPRMWMSSVRPVVDSCFIARVKFLHSQSVSFGLSYITKFFVLSWTLFPSISYIFPFNNRTIRELLHV